ncbi:MAG: undecaprenyl-diphosphatase UppP [Candidatus Andersenbacteria bacterium]
MQYLQAIVLGAVQGLTEFLPISSDGHLFIVRQLFGWSDQGLLFDAVLHIGTLLSIIIVLWRDLAELFVGFWQVITRRELTKTRQERLFVAAVVATIPAAVAGYFLEDLFTTTYRNVLSVGLWFAACGAFYLLAEQLVRKKQQTKLEPTVRDALAIGLAQVTALLPGVSRSGTTIATGSLVGLKREAAARFSFVMAAPIIAGASLLSLVQLLTGHAGSATAPVTLRDWLPLIVGTLVALVVGVFALKGLLQIVKRRGLRLFGAYMLTLGGLIVALHLFGIW